MRKNAGRHALRDGLLVSAVLHLAVFALNPGLELPLVGGSRRLLVTPLDGPAATLTVLNEARPARDAPSRIPRPAPTAAPLGADPDSLVAGVTAGVDAADSANPGRKRLSLLERLTSPRNPRLWRAPVPEPETREQRALRELAARLEAAGRTGGKPADDPWTVLARRGGVEIIAGRGGIGVRIPFGSRPPPPAQVVPAPPRLGLLASDSIRRRGERMYGYYGGYAIELPATLTQGVAFEISARFPEPVDSALVRFFVDGSSQDDAVTVHGVAHASLRIDVPGEHHIRVHFLGNGDYLPVEILHVVHVAGTGELLGPNAHSDGEHQIRLPLFLGSDSPGGQPGLIERAGQVA